MYEYICRQIAPKEYEHSNPATKETYSCSQSLSRLKTDDVVSSSS